MRGQRHNGGARRGFTLIELMVVIIIISIMSAVIVAEMHGTYQEALLRSTSRELASAFSAASSRAVSVNRPHRVRLDLAAHRYFLERSARGDSEFFPARDVPASEGALDSRISIKIREPGMESPEDAAGEPPADSGNRDNAASPEAEMAVTFYPDGTADERQIELTDRDGFRLALRINPVTSRVQITAMEHE